MNKSIVILFALVCGVTSFDFPEHCSNLVKEIVTKLVQSETGIHDVALVGFQGPIWDQLYRSISASDVTFRVLTAGYDAKLESRRKISLLLLDFTSFSFSEELSELFECLGPIWQSNAKVVIFLRVDQVGLMQRFGKVLKLYGASTVLFVKYRESVIKYYSIRLLENDVNQVENPIDELFDSKLNNVKQYKFKIYINAATPFHNFISENRAFGIDVELIELIIHHLNGSIKYTRISENLSKFINLSNITAQKQMFDFSLKYHAMITEEIDLVFLPNHEQYCVTVPKQHNRLMFLQLSRPFGSGVWFFVILFACFHLLFRNRINRLISKNPLKIQNLFTNHSKFFTITVEVFIFILIEAYLAKVITFLTTMQYEPNPRTIADLDRRKQTFVGNDLVIPFFKNYPNLKLLLNPTNTPDLFEKYATITYCKTAEYYSHSVLNYNPQTNDRKAFILEERLMSVINFFTFAKFSPFSSLFRQYISRLVDSGIWGKIYNQWSTSQSQFETLIELSEREIDFDDMVSLWAVTLVAYLICICVFVGEVTFGNRKKKQQ